MVLSSSSICRQKWFLCDYDLSSCWQRLLNFECNDPCHWIKVDIDLGYYSSNRFQTTGNAVFQFGIASADVSPSPFKINQHCTCLSLHTLIWHLRYCVWRRHCPEKIITLWKKYIYIVQTKSLQQSKNFKESIISYWEFWYHINSKVIVGIILDLGGISSHVWYKSFLRLRNNFSSHF